MAKVRWQQVERDGQTVVEEIHKIIVHRFQLGDVEDPDLYAAEPLYKWQQTEPGQFIMKHSIQQPIWFRNTNFATYGYEYIIVAELEAKKLSEYYLRWGKNGNF